MNVTSEAGRFDASHLAGKNFTQFPRQPWSYEFTAAPGIQMARFWGWGSAWFSFPEISQTIFARSFWQWFSCCMQLMAPCCPESSRSGHMFPVDAGSKTVQKWSKHPGTGRKPGKCHTCNWSRNGDLGQYCNQNFMVFDEKKWQLDHFSNLGISTPLPSTSTGDHLLSQVTLGSIVFVED